MTSIDWLEERYQDYMCRVDNNEEHSPLESPTAVIGIYVRPIYQVLPSPHENEEECPYSYCPSTTHRQNWTEIPSDAKVDNHGFIEEQPPV